MANHPINLALRFILELAALFAFGQWGWLRHTGFSRFLWAAALPLAAAVVWGTFRVPGDPGNAPVAVSGWVRLALELLFFGGAVWALAASKGAGWAAAFGAVVILHYLISYERIAWLIRQ